MKSLRHLNTWSSFFLPPGICRIKIEESGLKISRASLLNVSVCHQAIMPCPWQVFWQYEWLDELKKNNFLFGCAGLHWCMDLSVVAVTGASLHCGAWAFCYGGFSCCRAWALRHAGLVAAASGSGAQAQQLWHMSLVSCCVAFGIFPDQGSNPCLLHWQAVSLPLSPQGSPDWVNFQKSVFSSVWISNLNLNIWFSVSHWWSQIHRWTFEDFRNLTNFFLLDYISISPHAFNEL